MPRRRLCGLLVLQTETVRLHMIAKKEYEQQHVLNDREFYNATCAGAETFIIQLQEEIYSNCMLLCFYASLKARHVLARVPLEVYTGMDPNKWMLLSWVLIHQKIGMIFSEAFRCTRQCGDTS